MDGFWIFLFFVVGICFIIGIWVYEYNKKEKLKAELYKIVEQSGARNIHIKNGFGDSEHGVYSFVLTFTDRNGNRQKRHVTRHTTERANGTTDFLWDKPLLAEQDEHTRSRLSNKEQIISDMDAEIRRLRAELENARQDS